MTVSSGTPDRVVALISAIAVIIVGPKAIPTATKITMPRTPITVRFTMLPIEDMFFFLPNYLLGARILSTSIIKSNLK